MAPLWFTFYVVCLLELGNQILCENDFISGPLMKTKPDGQLYTTGELIELHGKKSETHKVTTEDGYILTVFRVLLPSPSTFSPVLLQHGYLGSSDVWVTDADSLALKLSEAGFDVWITNIRGNAYSRNHNKLKPEERDFWNFSWHEMGTKDLPAMIDYILQDTKKTSLHYVGYSMGSTMGYVMASTVLGYSTKMKSFLNFAPIVYMSKAVEMFGPDGMVGSMISTYIKDLQSNGKFDLFPRKDFMTNNKTQITCQDCGEDIQVLCEMKQKEITDFLGGDYLPGGTSFKTMEHFYQMSYTGEIRHYNMSSKEANQKVYGSEEPPSYIDKFNDITVPIYIWSATDDGLLKDEDIDKLVTKLPNVVANNNIKDECFDHITFVFAMKKNCLPVRTKIYQECIDAMKQQEKK